MEVPASRLAQVDGAEMHYMTADHGVPLILSHGSVGRHYRGSTMLTREFTAK